MNFDLNYVDKFNNSNLSLVVNCGRSIQLPDGTELKSFGSGLFQNIEIQGEHLLVLELDPSLDVSELVADYCRSHWAQVYTIFPHDEFKNTDFFRSDKVKLGNLEFNFWYCGEDFSCGIHNKHDFYELHTQILGVGEMQKFHQNDANTLYYREILNPGQTHTPFYDQKHNYPYHRYKSTSKCIWLAIENQNPFPL